LRVEDAKWEARIRRLGISRDSGQRDAGQIADRGGKLYSRATPLFVQRIDSGAQIRSDAGLRCAELADRIARLVHRATQAQKGELADYAVQRGPEAHGVDRELDAIAERLGYRARL